GPRPNAYGETLSGCRFAVELRSHGSFHFDLEDARAFHHDHLSVDVSPAIELAEGDERRPAREIAGKEDIELAVVQRCERRDVHARAEVRPIRGHDREASPAGELAVAAPSQRLR